jgi:hypothetical protein
MLIAMTTACFGCKNICEIDTEYSIIRVALDIRQTGQPSQQTLGVCLLQVWTASTRLMAAGGNHGDTARLPPGAAPFHCRIHNYYPSAQLVFSKVHKHNFIGSDVTYIENRDEEYKINEFKNL